MARTFNTTPDWVQLAHEAGVRLPRDWREPILDPVDGADSLRVQRGRWAPSDQLKELVGRGTIDAYFGPLPFGGRSRGIGKLATVQNRHMRHRHKQAIRQGRFDTPPPRHRHQALWDYW